MAYLFSSESISGGHPDKAVDQISDALPGQSLAYDSDAHCTIETFTTIEQVMIMGKVRSKEYVDLQIIARRTIKKIGYTRLEHQFDGDSYSVVSTIHERSEGIDRRVSRANEDEQGAGNQGTMFGYATNGTGNYTLVSLDLAHPIMQVLVDICKEGKETTYLRPDSRGQVTIEYNDDHTLRRVHTIVVSTQHDRFDSDDDRMLAKIGTDVINILIPRVKAVCDDKARTSFNDDILCYVNPTGKFVVGEPHGDTGFTGRKVTVDTYGGRSARGGRAFLGRDPNKVGRSIVYASRYVVKNLITTGVSGEVLVQISYAIDEAKSTNIYVDTYRRGKVGTTGGEIARETSKMYDLRPETIEKEFSLRNPIYFKIVAYGHMERQHEVKEKTLESRYHETEVMQVELFTWEELDDVERIKQVFGI